MFRYTEPECKKWVASPESDRIDPLNVVSPSPESDRMGSSRSPERLGSAQNGQDIASRPNWGQSARNRKQRRSAIGSFYSTAKSRVGFARVRSDRQQSGETVEFHS